MGFRSSEGQRHLVRYVTVSYSARWWSTSRPAAVILMTPLVRDSYASPRVRSSSAKGARHLRFGIRNSIERFESLGGLGRAVGCTWWTPEAEISMDRTRFSRL